MIEAEMVFALGFCTAALLGFLCLPVVWRRAVRLSTRRLEQLVPLSAEEVVAERDAMRAEFAVGQRRLEQKLEKAEHAKNEIFVERGRQEIRIGQLDAEVARAKVDVAALEAALAATSRNLLGAEAANGGWAVALFDATGLNDQYREELAELAEAKRRLEIAIDQGRTAIASLETRIVGLEARIVDLAGERDAARAEAAKVLERAEVAERERDAARDAAGSFAEQRNDLQKRLDEQLRDFASLKEETNRRAERDTRAEADAAALLLETKAELAAERVARAALSVDHDALLASNREREHRSAVALEAMRAEKAALERVLATAQAGPASGPSVDPADIAAVRDAIKAVADDVLRAASTTSKGAPSVSAASDPPASGPTA